MKNLFAVIVSTLAIAGAASAKTYDVAFDGSTIDLNGSIEFDKTGTFSLDDFSSLVGPFSITASQNGAAPFLFTQDNSSWGRGGAYGYTVTVVVSPDQITMSAPNPGMGENSGGNIFLMADTPTNGAIENLGLYADHLEYRMPAPSTLNASEYVTGYQFTALASAVPEPASALTCLLGLGGIALLRKRMN